jgi:hypothetical protein
MKLYQVLYEEKKNYTSYSPPDYGLLAKDNNTLVLFHIPSFLKYLKNEKSATYADVCAATIQVKNMAKKCMNALQVSVVAGSKKHPGAGITMYGLASDYYGAPLTSDRSHSTSIAGRETWAKIERSPDWKIAGDGLDNYADAGNKKVYMDISGTYPGLSAKPRLKKGGGIGGFLKNLLISQKTEPRTPEKIDDCPLPNYGGEITNTRKMANLLGTANAYRYVGPNKAAPLVQRAQEVIAKADSDLAINPNKVSAATSLDMLVGQLFGSRYEGSDTTR